MSKRFFILTALSALCVILLLRISGAANADTSSGFSNNASMQAAQSSTSHLYLPMILKNYAPPAPLWRIGINLSRRPLADYASSGLASMRFGWYMDYNVNSNAPEPDGIEYVPMVRLKQWKLLDPGTNTWTTWCVTCTYVLPYTYTLMYTSWSQLRQVAAARPGKTWIIGNEIERIDFRSGSQDEIVPELYAVAYHDIYSTIKSVDPTAQVAIGAVIEATPLRLQYFDLMWNAYSQKYGQSMPVDVWDIHGMVLPEKSCIAYPTDCWGAEVPAGVPATIGMTYTALDNKDFSKSMVNIVNMRTWMKNHGQQNKPLIITEYSVLMPDWAFCNTYPITTGCPFTPEQVRDDMLYPSFNYFLNATDTNLGYAADGYHMVQRWNWFSLDDDSTFWGGVPPSWLQGFGGNLFNSGLSVGQGGQPLGVSTLGSYWQQYVQPLPSAPTKPYAVTRSDSSKGVPFSPSVSAVDNPTAPANCGDRQKVRLLFFEPSTTGGMIENLRSQAKSPQLARESTICLPPQ